MNDVRPTAEVLIRHYRAEDQPGVEWLYARTPPWGQTYARPQPVPDDLLNITDHYNALLVAVEQTAGGEAVVGMTAIAQPSADPIVSIPDFIDLSITTTRLRHVVVAPERWRLGIGRTLVEAALHWCGSNGYKQVVLETTTEQEAALALYDAMGFARLGKSTIGRFELVWFALKI
jgi:ribosomal protein S18 acetylase RimI-like enzyme